MPRRPPAADCRDETTSLRPNDFPESVNSLFFFACPLVLTPNASTFSSTAPGLRPSCCRSGPWPRPCLLFRLHPELQLRLPPWPSRCQPAASSFATLAANVRPAVPFGCDKVALSISSSLRSSRTRAISTFSALRTAAAAAGTEQAPWPNLGPLPCEINFATPAKRSVTSQPS